MGDGYLVPDELDTQKGEVAVKPPVPTKPTTTVAGVGQASAPTGCGRTRGGV